MTELQEALAEREGQLQLQHRQCWQLNEQLQAALQQLAHAEAQLVATDAQAVAATSASAALQEQLTAAEQAAAGAAEANAALLQQLGAAEQAAALVQEQLKQKEWELQGLLSSHTAAVLDSAAMELQLEGGLASQDTLEAHVAEAQQTAAEAALQGLRQQLHSQASQQGTDVHDGEVAHLQQQLAAAEAQVLDLQQQLHLQQVQHIQAQQAWQQQLEAATRALAEQQAAVTSGAGRMSGSTAVLEGHLEDTTAEVAHCMDMLAEVAGTARRSTVDWPKTASGGGAGPTARRTDETD